MATFSPICFGMSFNSFSGLFYFNRLSEARICEDIKDEGIGPLSDVSGL